MRYHYIGKWALRVTTNNVQKQRVKKENKQKYADETAYVKPFTK